MITGDERRAVVERLRRLQSRQFRDEDKPEITTWEDIGTAVLDSETWGKCDRLRSRDNRTRAVRSVIAGRLADLIEPPTQCPYYHSDRHRCSAYDDVVDRDALLKLADEMESLCGPWSDCGRHYAPLIRKALGVGL